MYENLKIIGLSHDSSPIAIRELVTFSENENKNFLNRMREVFDLDEALIISTCNRTEIYYVSDIDLSNSILNLLKFEKVLIISLILIFEKGESYLPCDIYSE